MSMLRLVSFNTFEDHNLMADAQPTESGALTHPNVQFVKDYQAAMARGDFVTGATFFAPDVTYTVPGHNALSGNFKGPQQVMGYFGKLMELTHGTYRIIEMRWLVNDTGKVALVTRNYAEINGRNLTWDETIIFEIKDHKKVGIELFQADQTAVDAFFNG